MSLAILRLKPRQEKRLLAGHLWIYSNEIDTQISNLSQFQAGELVQLQSSRDQPIGIGYINPKTLLCARLLTRNVKQNIDELFFQTQIKKALEKRERWFAKPYYRLIYSESDELPGLIVDRYNDVLVCQVTTAGMERLTPLIQAALDAIIQPKTIIWQQDLPYREIEGLPINEPKLVGEKINEVHVEENNCRFVVSLTAGQKTGWFYDHRDNRALIAQHVTNKKVLDVFSYIGAFTIPMAKNGAKEVTCIDSSAYALEQLQRNAELNQVQDKVKPLRGNAFDLLAHLIADKQQYDVIVLDPPALIKKKKDFHGGAHAYEKLNAQALQLLSPTGLLLTASCSMHYLADDLLSCIRKAALKQKRDIAVLAQCHQSADHPIHLAISETNYLKGFVVI